MKRNEKQNCKHIKRICEKCKYWKKYGYDPIIEKCWGECCRPFGEDGVTQETAENDFCSFAKEATDYPTEKGCVE